MIEIVVGLWIIGKAFSLMALVAFFILVIFIRIG